MSWEAFWLAIGSLLAGGTLVWMIFAFYADKRDRAHQDEKHNFFESLAQTEERIEKHVASIEHKYAELERLVTTMDKTLSLQVERYGNMTGKFEEYAREMRQIIAAHAKELTDLGKIIRRGG